MAKYRAGVYVSKTRTVESRETAEQSGRAREAGQGVRKRGRVRERKRKRERDTYIHKGRRGRRQIKNKMKKARKE